MTRILSKSLVTVAALATGSALISLRGVSDGDARGGSIAAHLTAPPPVTSIWFTVQDSASRDTVASPDSVRRDTIRNDSLPDTTRTPKVDLRGK